MTKRTLIGVLPGKAYQCRQRLFNTLSRLHPADFEPRETVPTAGLDAVLLLNHSPAAALAAAQAGLAVCHFSGVTAAATAAGPEVSFSGSLALDHTLRGQRLADESAGVFVPLTPDGGDEVMAEREGAAFWRRRKVGRGLLHRVAVEPPMLGESECLWRHFNAASFATLLPLLQFLREVTGGVTMDLLPLRAAFVFDDPDLSQFRYGCLDYERLARHAAEHDYHAAIALVPLTAERVDARLAEFFRAHPRQLSLLIHGNDHTRHELLDISSEEQAMAVLAQARQRIERMEQRHGLEVARVMEAPHAAINCKVFPALAALGYEAALVTTARMLFHNPQTVWPPEFGMSAAGVTPEGLGYLPRIRMSGCWRTDAVLAAFLRQPIVLAGHHRDAADDLGLLAEFARLVNGFGPVQWGSLTAIARGNYTVGIAGESLRVKAGQRRLEVQVPPGVTQLTLERPWLNEASEERLCIQLSTGETLCNELAGRVSRTLPVTAGSRLDVRSTIPNAADTGAAAARSLSAWPRVRRRMTELRDRAYPWLKTVRDRWSGTSNPSR